MDPENFEKLKALGIVLKSSTAIERAYDMLKALPVMTIADDKLLVLDLHALPNKPFPLREVFLRWAIGMNEGRLLQGLDPVFPMALIKLCPLWRFVKPPFKTLKLTKEGMFNKPRTIVPKMNVGPEIRSFNKKK